MEAKSRNADNVIMVNAKGMITEAGNANVFMVRKGKIFTPEKEILKGIGRSVIIKIAKKKGYAVIEKNISRKDLLSADEIFLTGSGKGVMPVIKADGKVIGSGKQGKITRELKKDFQARYF